MPQPVASPPDFDEDAAELAALAAAVQKSLSNDQGIPHAQMRAWLLEIAAGNFAAERPVARKL